MLALLFSLLLTGFFSIISTAIMLYISMATPVGPWIETSLALIGLLIIRLISYKYAPSKYSAAIACATAAGGIAGIIATGVGFAFPALYFIDTPSFNNAFLYSFDGIYILGGLVLVAGLIGLLSALLFSYQVLEVQQLPFSIGTLVAHTLTAFDRINDAYQLIAGVIISSFYMVMFKLMGVVQSITVHSYLLRLDLLPIFLAIGFVSGTLLALPLSVGMLLKVLFVELMHEHFFTYVSLVDFQFAFLSGLVIYSALHSMWDIPYRWYKKLHKNVGSLTSVVTSMPTVSWRPIIFFVGGSIPVIVYWWLQGVSLLGSLFIVAGSFVCAYQLLIIAGKIGMAPLGRFATFIMIPSLFVFGVSSNQAIFISTFIEVAGGVAVDTLFGQRMALEVGISRKRVFMYQVLGLLIAVCTIGVIFSLLHAKFGIGSAELLVQRARGRVLFLNMAQFDVYAMALGIALGAVLQYCAINSLLVLGGIVMSLESSSLLLMGAMLSYVPHNPAYYYPWWSGIFASASLWMVLSAFW